MQGRTPHDIHSNGTGGGRDQRPQGRADDRADQPGIESSAGFGAPGRVEAGGDAMMARELSSRFDDIHLDALGLLDDPDRLAFEAWLASLPKAARRQVRWEQARLAMTAPGIDAQVPGDLRQHAIVAIIEACREERLAAASADDRAVLAEVGVGVNPAVGRELSASNGQHSEGSAGVRRHRAHSRGEDESHRWSSGVDAAGSGRRNVRVHGSWRAATIVLSVAMVAMTAVYAQLREISGNVSMQNELGALIEKGGGHLGSLLFDPSSQRVMFDRAAEDLGPTRAMILIAEDESKTPIFIERLAQPKGSRLMVCAVNERNEVVGEALAVFEPDGVLQRVYVDLRLAITDRLAIVAANQAEMKPILVAKLPGKPGSDPDAIG